MKTLPKILKIIFLVVFILQMIGLIYLLAIPEISQAQTTAKPITFEPQVDIPGTDVSGTIGPSTIGNYIQAIYKYAIGIVGILASVVLMIGGVIWLTAGGNQTKIGEAKAWIGASLTGLIIALSSYMILYTVNPDLVRFKPIELKKPENLGESSVLKGLGKCYYINEFDVTNCMDDYTKTTCEKCDFISNLKSCTFTAFEKCNGDIMGSCEYVTQRGEKKCRDYYTSTSQCTVLCGPGRGKSNCLFRSKNNCP